MAARFVLVDHDTPLLLPPDLRDWVPADHLVHIIMDAVAAVDLPVARLNDRGTGSGQYPPSMMLGLLIFNYATGTFSSCKIQTATYENLAARILKVGDLTVALDGTKLLAKAGKHSAMSHGRIVGQRQLASDQISELLAKAEDADSTPLADGLSIPAKIQRRHDRLANLKKAKALREERARFEEQSAIHAAKLAARQEKQERNGKKPRDSIKYPKGRGRKK